MYLKKWAFILFLMIAICTVSFSSTGFHFEDTVLLSNISSFTITNSQDNSFFQKYGLNLAIKVVLLVIILFLAFLFMVLRSQKKEKDKKLETTEYEFYKLINFLPDAMVIHGNDGKILHINDKVSELLGYSFQELKDIQPEQIFPDENVSKYYSAIETVLKQKKPIVSEKIAVYNKEGKLRIIDFNSVPSLNSQGEVEGIYSIVRDITDIVQDRDKIQNQNKELSFFYELSLLVLQSGSQDVYSRIVSLISEYYSSPYCFLLLYDRIAEKTKILAASRATGLIENSEKSIDECAACKAVKSGHPLYIADLQAAQAEEFRELHSSGVCSIIFVPILHHGIAIGAVAVGDNKTRLYTDNDINSLSIAANAIALFLENIYIQNDRNRFFEMSVDMFTIFYPSAFFKEINSAWTKNLGWSKEEFISQSMIDFLHPDDIPAFEKMIERLNQFKPVLFLEIRFKTHSGEYRNLSWNAFKSNEDGLNYAVVRDLTAVRLAQKALNDAEARFKSLFMSMSEGVAFHTIIYDEHRNPVNYVITDVNTAYEKITKMKKENCINRPATEVYNTAAPPYFLDYLRVLKGAPLQFETYFAPMDKYFFISAVAIAEDKFATIFSDITANKKNEIEKENLMMEIREAYQKEQSAREELESALEEINAAYQEMEITQKELLKSKKDLEKAVSQAEEANRLKTEFLAIISHELRTPLTSMLGFSQLLTTELNDNPTHKQFAGHIYNSGQRLLDVVNDLLEISVMEAGKIKIEYDFFDIQVIIQGITALFKGKLEKKGLQFIVENSNVTTLYSDEARIRQILFNLIGNAIKFTEKGEIKLVISQKNQCYHFSVSDTGIGINKEQFETIFDMFTQVEDHLKRKYQGIGLGLAICKRLVKALKGKIWVESQEALGSTFRFEIPMPAPITTKDDNSIAEVKKDTETDLLQNIKILFAEDDPVNYVLIAYLLRQMNIKEIKGVTNGLEAVNAYQESPDYDVIILDIQMPELNGIECLSYLRELECQKPIIALTAFASHSDREKLLDMGFDDFIAKPIDADSLQEKLERLTNSKYKN